MIPELINKLLENDLISKEQYKSLSPLKKPYGKKLGKFLIESDYLTKKNLETFIEQNKQSLFELFDNFINENSKLAKSIIWNDDSKNPKSYNNWLQSNKIELSTTFWSQLLDIHSDLDEAPTCTITLDDDGEVLSTDLQPEDAWKYYINYIAHCLRVELDRLVQLSLLKYNEKQLKLLLDSHTLFEYSKSRKVYSIFRRHESLFNHGSVTIGDPVRIYDFLDEEKLISITRWGTIGYLLGWCRDNLYHFKDGNTPENYQDHWQYEGYPPVERISLEQNILIKDSNIIQRVAGVQQDFYIQY